MKVSEFINQNTATWNLDKLQMFFLPEDIEAITSIRLSRYHSSDHYVWPYTKNLEYTVKSGYWAATHDFMDNAVILPPSGSVVLKTWIWKLEILPKVQQFLWRVVSSALPTYVQLCSRGIYTDPIC